ncbi:MAG: hypothetical protein QNK37_00070 [Acidobacteriota bacterium]|nr:hypothetical protein [Acidobacteriota bacterium]
MKWFPLVLLSITANSVAGSGKLEIDELGTATLVSSATLNRTTLFTTMDWVGRLKIETILFDADSRQSVVIEDGRIPKLSDRVIAGREAYFLLSRNADSIVMLGTDGGFLEKFSYSGYFTGEELNGMTLFYIYPHRENMVLLTYKKADWLFLAVGEMENRTADIVTALKIDPEQMGYWVSDGESIYYINPFTSGIEKLDSQYEKAALLRAHREPVLDVQKKKMFDKPKVRAMLAERGMSPYQRMLLNPIITNGKISFSLNQWRDNYGEEMKELKKFAVLLENGVPLERKREDVTVVVGDSSAGTLYYNHAAGDFAFSKKSR